MSIQYIPICGQIPLFVVAAEWPMAVVRVTSISLRFSTAFWTITSPDAGCCFPETLWYFSTIQR